MKDKDCTMKSDDTLNKSAMNMLKITKPIWESFLAGSAKMFEEDILFGEEITAASDVIHDLGALHVEVSDEMLAAMGDFLKSLRKSESFPNKDFLLERATAGFTEIKRECQGDV
jgi:hypothetical protein